MGAANQAARNDPPPELRLGTALRGYPARSPRRATLRSNLGARPVPHGSNRREAAICSHIGACLPSNSACGNIKLRPSGSTRSLKWRHVSLTPGVKPREPEGAQRLRRSHGDRAVGAPSAPQSASVLARPQLTCRARRAGAGQAHRRNWARSDRSGKQRSWSLVCRCSLAFGRSWRSGFSRASFSIRSARSQCVLDTAPERDGRTANQL